MSLALKCLIFLYIMKSRFKVTSKLMSKALHWAATEKSFLYCEEYSISILNRAISFFVYMHCISKILQAFNIGFRFLLNQWHLKILQYR